jgi:hypothetical protein
MIANTATASATSRTMTSFISFADVPDHATPHRRARPGQQATTSRLGTPHSATTSSSCPDVAFRPTSTRSHDASTHCCCSVSAHSVWEAQGDRGDSLDSRHDGWSRGSGEKSLVEASRERGSNPARRRVLHPGRVGRRKPTAAATQDPSLRYTATRQATVHPSVHNSSTPTAMIIEEVRPRSVRREKDSADENVLRDMARCGT